jgi:hypothetical protein
MGMGAQEGLGLIEDYNRGEWWFDRLFHLGTVSAFGRNLNPAAYYIAMRFAYGAFQGVFGDILPGNTRDQIRRGLFVVEHNGSAVFAQAADWGPNADTGRLIDCSPGVLAKIGAQTDSVVNVSFIEA